VSRPTARPAEHEPSTGDEPAAQSPGASLGPSLGASRQPSRGPWRDVADNDWASWKWQQTHRLRKPLDFEATVGLSEAERKAFTASAHLFDVAVTPYYASLMGDDPQCPIRMQSLPNAAELTQYDFELEDPLGEEAHMAAPGVTHRYPDRVLFYVTHNCPVYCRHCTRKRKVADPGSAATRSDLSEGLAYIAGNPNVRDVLLSGGDPLTLSDARLNDLFEQLMAIDHVEVLRLGTRNPVTLPQRVTPALCDVLRKVRPLYVHTHFNHPKECTPEAALALERLADAGCVLGNQMVLMRGVNDDEETVLQLNRWLLKHRCRPYYIFQADMAQGITHFRTPLKRGIEIIDFLRGRISGMGVPHFAIDLPGGGGKITLTPEYEVSRRPTEHGVEITYRNTKGQHFTFRDVPE
jgi:lysine 2,3-aminomutase